MAKDQSASGRRVLRGSWVVGLLLLMPAGAAAQEDAMTPELASAALSQLGSIFLANHTGYGTTGVFNTKGGQWVRDPQHGLTYVCNVEAAVIPTTAGAQNGVAYGSQVQVFVDPESGRVRITGGDSNGWERTETPLSDLREQFPSEPPPPESPQLEAPGADAPGNSDPGDGDAVDAFAGVLGLLAGELGRSANETVAVAEPPPEIPTVPAAPEPSPPSTPHEPPPTPRTPPPPSDPPPSRPPDPPPSDPEPPPTDPMQQTLEEHDPGTPGQTPCVDDGSWNGCVPTVDLGDTSQIPEDTRSREEREEAARQQYEAFMQTVQQLQESNP